MEVLAMDNQKFIPIPDLAEAFAEILRTCVEEQDLEPPICVASVAASGGVSVVRLTPGDEHLEPTMIAAHDEPDGMSRFPINLMVTDSRGTAVLVSLQQPDGSWIRIARAVDLRLAEVQALARGHARRVPSERVRDALREGSERPTGT
jgi:hypothetical protein